MLNKSEQDKRNELMLRKPYVAKKLAKINEMEENGEISPIIRLEKVICVISSVLTVQQNIIWIDIPIKF